jgi:hypothetical protein
MAKFSVRAGETGAIRGDGTGSRTFTTTPTPPGRNITTNQGRHSVGQPLARPGTQREGQGARRANGVGTGYNQKTGARPEMSPRQSIGTDAKLTSQDLERRISAAPQPFTYEGLAATSPTDRHDGSTEGVPYNVEAGVNAKPQSYGKLVGVGNTNATEDELAAVGYTRAEIMAARGSREQDSVRGVRGNQRQTGMPGTKNTNTTARANSRMR